MAQVPIQEYMALIYNVYATITNDLLVENNLSLLFLRSLNTSL